MLAAPHDTDQSDSDGGDTADSQFDGDEPPNRAASASDNGRRDGEPSPDGERRESSADPGGRDVVVPMRIYKLVTVVTSLLAVPLVVLGFMFLDAATLQVSFMRGVILTALRALGVPVDRGALSAVLAVIGLSVIALGASVYVLGARFRAAGMGNAKESADEESTNG